MGDHPQHPGCLSAFISVHQRPSAFSLLSNPFPPPISRNFKLILNDLPPRTLPARATMVSGGTFDRPTARSAAKDRKLTFYQTNPFSLPTRTKIGRASCRER